MKQTRTTSILIGAMNVLSVAGSALSTHAAYAEQSNKPIEKLNAVSLKSIESAWIQIPQTCKARSFNADPVSLVDKSINNQIQSIYAVYGS